MTGATAPVVTAAGGASPLLPPTPDDVLRLQAVTDYPSVTVLLPTTPGPRLTARDAERARALVSRAQARLATELEPAEVDPVVDRLRCLLLDALERPADRALALFAGWQTAALHHLPVEVDERVVVDPTFATRDLVRAVQRRPRHLVLVLAGDGARLLAHDGHRLADVHAHGFPYRPGREDLRGGAAGLAAVVRHADRALSAVLRTGAAPVVVVGVDRVLGAFRSVTRNGRAVAGDVRGSHLRTPAEELEQLARPAIDALLARREAEACGLARERVATGRGVCGLDRVWLAAVTDHPDMLVVEEGLSLPARLSEDGLLLLPADDPEHPEVVDDTVDELIETVLARGGWVAMVADGALSDLDRVALTFR